MSQSDEPIVLSEEDGIKLDKKEDALWNSEHTSDEEEFDPANPADLTTATAKADAEENGEDVEEEEEQEPTSEDDRDATDDSIVNDEIESVCPDHKACTNKANTVCDAMLVNHELKGKRKHAVAALAEAFCDNFSPK